jgi:AbrB family looped-hinge helix DNA binding protein
MLGTIDKRGSFSLPACVRKELGFGPGTHLELSVEPGGSITLYPVEIYRSIKLNDSGLLKLNEAGASEATPFPGCNGTRKTGVKIQHYLASFRNASRTCRGELLVCDIFFRKSARDGIFSRALATGSN